MIDAAVVLLYQPAPDSLEAIATYAGVVKTLYVVDNSPEPSAVLSDLQVLTQTRVLSSGRNMGIAAAYNLAFHHAHRDGHRWLMTMDQDSSFDAEEKRGMLDHFYRYRTGNLGIYTPLHNQKLLSSLPPQSKVSVMSSANIVNIEAALRIGGFDEKLFIDEVDHDFCFRMKSAGYLILEDQEVYVHHRLGKRDPLTNKVYYSSGRLYYMARNYLYIAQKYKKHYPDFFKERSIYLIKFFFWQIYHAPKKKERIRMILLGVRDYYRDKMGYRYAC